MNENAKVALITGATRGIGKQIALELASQGYNIALNYRKQNEELEEARMIARGLKDIEEGKVVDGPEAIEGIRKKYGL